jgi:hypothetical protein
MRKLYVTITMLVPTILVIMKPDVFLLVFLVTIMMNVLLILVVW